MTQINTHDPKRILILDTETTGLDAAQDELLQVSIINADGEILYNRHLKPKKKQSWPEAEAVNRISPAMVQDAPTVDQERSTIAGILATAEMIVGYNISFDVEFLQAAEIPVPDWTGDLAPCDYEDIMSMFAPIAGEWNRYCGTYRWQSLSTAAHWYRYTWPEGPAHDALADCFATLYVWQQMHDCGDWEWANSLLQETQRSNAE